MNMLTLDFSKVKTENDMHQLLKETFHFPDFYGCNWDAFWDMIYDYIDRNVIIKIVNLDSLPDDLKQDSEIMLKIFKRISEKFSGISILVE